MKCTYCQAGLNEPTEKQKTHDYDTEARLTKHMLTKHVCSVLP
jgi:hypothetical protein